MKKQIIKKETLIKAILLGSVLVMMPDLMAATGTTLGGRADELTDDVRGVGSLFRWIVALVGAFLAFGGIMGLKKYADDPRSNPIMKPLLMAICGGFALGFSAFTELLSNTANREGVEEGEVFETRKN